MLSLIENGRRISIYHSGWELMVYEVISSNQLNKWVKSLGERPGLMS